MKLLIIFVSILVFVSVIATIMVGVNSFEGVVVDKPYEHALHWDKDRNYRLNSEWSVEFINNNFRKGPNDIVFSLLDKAKKPLAGVSVSITISRPATNIYDKTYNAVAQKDGVYSVKADLPLYGHWDVRINVAENGRNIVFEKKIYAVK